MINLKQKQSTPYLLKGMNDQSTQELTKVVNSTSDNQNSVNSENATFDRDCLIQRAI